MFPPLCVPVCSGSFSPDDLLLFEGFLEEVKRGKRLDPGTKVNLSDDLCAIVRHRDCSYSPSPLFSDKPVAPPASAPIHSGDPSPPALPGLGCLGRVDILYITHLICFCTISYVTF